MAELDRGVLCPMGVVWVARGLLHPLCYPFAWEISASLSTWCWELVSWSSSAAPKSRRARASKRDAGGCCFPCSLRALLLQSTPRGWRSETWTRACLGLTTSTPTTSRYLGRGGQHGGAVFTPLLVWGCSTGVNLEGAACQEPSASPGSFSAVSPRDLTVLPSPICPHPRVDLDPLLSLPAREVLGD